MILYLGFKVVSLKTKKPRADGFSALGDKLQPADQSAEPGLALGAPRMLGVKVRAHLMAHLLVRVGLLFLDT